MNDEQVFIKTFREVQPKFSRFFARSLFQTHLTLPQYALLNVLASAGTVSMTDVSGKLHITKPAVTNLVDRLEKNKFLKRLSHPEDRRCTLIQIQPKGEKVVRQIQTAVLRFLLRTLHHFSAAERKVITRFYALLSKTVDEVLKHPKRVRK